MTTNLIKEFERTGLELQLPVDPLVRTNPDIFQMDIQRQRGREWFRLWRGHEANQVRITDVDRPRRQLVLLIQEQSRTFRERLNPRFVNRRRLAQSVARDDARVLKDTSEEIVVERWTSGSMRRFLCGNDERHLFVAQFDGGTSVRDAHRQLKPREVREAERSGAGRILRQGEWFFAPLSALEKRLFDLDLAETPYIVRRWESLGGNGRPHMADFVVRLEGRRVYARGAIRHPDHKTLVLGEWRRVYRNAEVRQQGFGSNGIYWID
jgi:hypothetical protein